MSHHLESYEVKLIKVYAVSFLDCQFKNTVVPALGDPVVSGHLLCTDTLSMSRHISTLNYLGSAATCLTRTRTVMYWLSAPAITDSANICHVFCGHFNQKSLAHTQTWDRQFLKFPCFRLVTNEQYVTSSRLVNHVIAANQPLHLLRLFHDINGKVTYSVCSTRHVEEQNDS